VTDVAPRLVTAPLITCVCVVLPPLDVVEAMLVEWVCVDPPARFPPEATPVVLLGAPEVVATGSTVCVCEEWFGIEKLSACPCAMLVVWSWDVAFAVSGANVPALLVSAPTVARPAAKRSRISGRVNVPDTTPNTAARAGYVAWL
jgi:hypothetical protein